MVGMPGFWPDFDQIFDQIFGQVFDQIFGQVFDQGFWIPNYSVQVYWGGEIQFYSSTGKEKYSFTVLPGRNKKREKTEKKN